MPTTATVDANKQVFHAAATALFRDRNLDAIDQYYAPHYVHHDPVRDAMVKNLSITHHQATKQFFQGFLTAFPDVKLTIEHVYAEGDKVFAFVSWHGTHSGPFMGMPPTGKTITIKTAEIFRLENGVFVEHWDVVDDSELQQALRGE